MLLHALHSTMLLLLSMTAEAAVSGLRSGDSWNQQEARQEDFLSTLEDHHPKRQLQTIALYAPQCDDTMSSTVGVLFFDVEVEMSFTSPTDNLNCSNNEHEKIGTKVQNVIDNFDASMFLDDNLSFAASMCNTPGQNATQTTTTGRMLRIVSYTYRAGAACRLCSRDSGDVKSGPPPLTLRPPTLGAAPSSQPSTSSVPSSAPSLSPWTIAIQSIEARLAEEIDNVLENSSEIPCLSGTSVDASVALTPLNRPSEIKCIAEEKPQPTNTTQNKMDVGSLPTNNFLPPTMSAPTAPPSSTAPSTKPPTRPPTKPPTKPPTRPPTKPPSTKPPTKPPSTKPPSTKPPTRPPTRPRTRPPTKVPTKKMINV